MLPVVLSLHARPQRTTLDEALLPIMTDGKNMHARDEVINSMERSAEVFGLSRSAGRVYGVLYFADSPLSIPELVTKTGYAKSTISTVTRKLTRIGMIRRQSSSGGGRRVQFEPVRDQWLVIQDVLHQYLNREFTTTRRDLQLANERLESQSDPESTEDCRRVQELEARYEELQTLLQLMTEYSASELIEAIEQYER